MTSMFRSTACVLLLTLVCASTARAFPPCPIDEAGIVPLDAPPLSGSGLAPWKVATVTSIGTLAPDSFFTPCLNLADDIRAGECKVDMFHLDALPAFASAGLIAGAPTYSNASRIGIIGLPELRNADVLKHTPVYALTLGINPTPLANAGDWIDIAQMQMDADADADFARGAIYRLRKITLTKGQTELRLILSMPDARRDIVVAAAPLDTKRSIAAITLRWWPLVQTSGDVGNIDSHGIGTPSQSGYAINTSLALSVDGSVVYRTTLKQQAPSIASVGVLDYNLPYAPQMAAASLEDPIAVPIGPAPLPTAGASAGAAMDARDPLEAARADDVPGALLIYYYTKFSVISM